MTEHTQLTNTELHDALAALGRRGEEGSAAWIAIQDELTQRRLKNDDALIHPPPPSRPLRKQILDELAKESDLTPTEIAFRLDTAPSVISRLLGILKRGGLITEKADPHDGRRRLYRLAEGTTVTELCDEDVPKPSNHEMVEEYIDLTFEAALRARRQRNDLDYAEDRLRRVLKAAEDLPSPPFQLKARSELLVTLRQARDTARNAATERGKTVEEREKTAADHQRLSEAYTAELRRIEAYGEGREGATANDLVLPATGCLLYERGRSSNEQLQDRLDHLAGAALVFERYEEVSQSKYWGSRKGWALLARGEIFRNLTEYDRALPFAKAASECFDDYYQQYGNAEAHRLVGFCHRLLGNFDEAIAVLKIALKLAVEVNSARCRADVLYLLGETYRCNGALDAALGYLEEAQELAESLERERSLGFTLSALSATRFDSGDLGKAAELSKDASKHLETSKGGLALNTRRRAVIARDQDNDDCVALFADATKRYEELRSPAGQAACLVGLGKHLQRHPDRNTGDSSTTTVVQDLGTICREDAALDHIRSDPWVPKLIGSWHKDFEINRELGEIVEWIGTSSEADDGHVDEMGGEPRVINREPVGV